MKPTLLIVATLLVLAGCASPAPSDTSTDDSPAEESDSTAVAEAPEAAAEVVDGPYSSQYPEFDSENLYYRATSNGSGMVPVCQAVEVDQWLIGYIPAPTMLDATNISGSDPLTGCVFVGNAGIGRATLRFDTQGSASPMLLSANPSSCVPITVAAGEACLNTASPAVATVQGVVGDFAWKWEFGNLGALGETPEQISAFMTGLANTTSTHTGAVLALSDVWQYTD